MKIFLASLLLGLSLVSLAQQRMHISFIDDKGNKKTIIEARSEGDGNLKYLIAVKRYRDTLFERLEYNYKGPLISLTSFKDSALTTKNGHYIEYAATGYISREGQYRNNEKIGNWYQYGDTSHPSYEYKYVNDKIIERTDLDSLSIVSKRNSNISEEQKPNYKGGDTVFSRLIGNKLGFFAMTGKLKRSGFVRIRFIVDSSGKIDEFYFSKSSSFLFDEPCLAIIQSIPNNWVPGTQNGKKLNSYYEQPIGFRIKNDEFQKK